MLVTADNGGRGHPRCKSSVREDELVRGVIGVLDPDPNN